VDVLDMSKSSPYRRRALIVEDEYLIANDLEATMHALGFDDCDVAPNARQAHSLSMHARPDIVVVDVCLEGGREGIEVARWLREIFEVPVVFVTSYSDDDTVERIRSLVPGAPVLPKPVYPECLAEAIAEASKSAARAAPATTH
jgi:DNA-binding response OmpR family regulator